MMRWKWILAIAVSFVMGGFIAIYIILASYDYNKLKPQITGFARENTGRELTLAGDNKLGIGLSPNLRVENVSFQNATWGSRPELAKVERLEIQLELLALIRGDIQIKRLILLKPDFLLETDKSGKSNMALDVSGQEEPAPETKEYEDAVPTLFTFNKISIKDGKIMLYDHQAGSKHMIRLDQFDLQAPEFGAPADMVFNGAYNDIPFQASGKIGPLSGVLDPAESWPFELKVRAIESSIEIAGQFQDPMGAKGIDVKLSAEGRDLGNFRKITGEPLPVQGPFKASGHLVAPDFNIIKLENFSIVLGTNRISGTAAVDMSSEKPEITATLTSERLDLRPVLAQPEKKTTAGKKKPTKGLKKRVDADQVDLGKMLKELEITEALDGLLDFDINLKGRGNSMAAIMAGLNGDVIAVIGEGRIPVHYLDLLGADLQTSMLELLNPLQEKEDVSKVNCMVCDCT